VILSHNQQYSSDFTHGLRRGKKALPSESSSSHALLPSADLFCLDAPHLREGREGEERTLGPPGPLTWPVRVPDPL